MSRCSWIVISFLRVGIGVGVCVTSLRFSRKGNRKALRSVKKCKNLFCAFARRKEVIKVSKV